MNRLMITIRDLQFSWPASEFSLQIPSLDVTSGSAVAITGPSGSGKTTLLNIIAGIQQGLSGSVKIKDAELIQMPDSQRRAFRLRQIGLVFQSFELIEYLTVLDNVLLPARINPVVTLTPDLRDRARGLLTQVGLERAVTRSVTRLSQGERQRVAICRALLTNPPLLLADEPTGNLDPDSTLRIVNILISQVREHGTTLLMVSHDHGLLPHFDSIIDFNAIQKAESVVGGFGAA
jgi:putative ABC transport system ATP-binding protein